MWYKEQDLRINFDEIVRYKPTSTKIIILKDSLGDSHDIVCENEEERDILLEKLDKFFNVKPIKEFIT